MLIGGVPVHVLSTDMPEIAHITGVGTDGDLYGLDAASTVLASRDAGLTWFTPATVAPIGVAVPNYSFDVNALTTTPRDDDVVTAGSVLWGLTSQGVHYNTNGSWELHGGETLTTFWTTRPFLFASFYRLTRAVGRGMFSIYAVIVRIGC